MQRPSPGTFFHPVNVVQQRGTNIRQFFTKTPFTYTAVWPTFRREATAGVGTLTPPRGVCSRVNRVQDRSTDTLPVDFRAACSCSVAKVAAYPPTNCGGFISVGTTWPNENVHLQSIRTNLWNVSGTETWEKLSVPGLKPQPRAESVALAVSELLLRGSCTVDHTNVRFRNQRSRLASNRVSPSGAPTRPSFLKEISKLSQINLSRLSHPTKCSYSVLNGQDDHEETPQEVRTSSEYENSSSFVGYSIMNLSSKSKLSLRSTRTTLFNK